MTRARDIADSTKTLSVDGGTIKLDGNYPVGTNNVALGNAALDAITTGEANVAIGNNALTTNTTGLSNISIGSASMENNVGGNYNTAVGVLGLRANTSGANNTGLGYGALRFNTTASNNTAVGYLAGYSNTTGADNVLLGFQAGRSQTTASDNIKIGPYAGHDGNGVQNCFIGRSSGYYSSGSYNTFVGRSVTDGAGGAMTTGSKNTILGGYTGNQGGLDIRTSSNNIVLSDGDGNPRMRVTSTGQFMFPGSASPNPHTNGSGVQIYGVNGIMIGSDSTHALIAARHNSSGECIRLQRDNTDVGSIDVTTTSTSYNTTSDYRLKENVVGLTGATDRLKQLNPSRFNFIADAETTVDGFLAHEVQSVVPEAVTGAKDAVDADGNPEYQGIDQSKLVPLLVATIKELEARITALENA